MKIKVIICFFGFLGLSSGHVLRSGKCVIGINFYSLSLVHLCNYNLPIAEDCLTLPLDTLSIRATCTESDLSSFPCPEMVPSNTTVRIECKAGYRKPDDHFVDTIHCQADGNWSSPIPQCTAKCIEISQAESTSPAPWNVLIYKKQNSKFVQICRGTIINETMVVTDAHCFMDSRTHAIKYAEYSIVAGKSFPDYYTPEPGTKELQVALIETWPGYFGSENNFSGNLAVLTLQDPLIFQDNIMPICVKLESFRDKVNFTKDLEGRLNYSWITYRMWLPDWQE